MNTSSMKIGQIFRAEGSVKMLDGSGTSVRFCKDFMFLGGRDFRNFDGSISHFTASDILALYPSPMTADEFEKNRTNR